MTPPTFIAVRVVSRSQLADQFGLPEDVQISGIYFDPFTDSMVLRLQSGEPMQGSEPEWAVDQGVVLARARATFDDEGALIVR